MTKKDLYSIYLMYSAHPSKELQERVYSNLKKITQAYIETINDDDYFSIKSIKKLLTGNELKNILNSYLSTDVTLSLETMATLFLKEQNNFPVKVNKQDNPHSFYITKDTQEQYNKIWDVIKDEKIECV